jgi:hypothetical protein
VLLAAALVVSGCGSVGVGRTASGTTASRRIDATGVTRLDVAYGSDVRVRLGQPEAVTVTYDDNLADLLDVRVDGTPCASNSGRTPASPTARPCEQR